MATIKTGGLLEVISGKVGGQVFAHNRAGKYVRGMSIPVNPRTTRQGVIREAMGDAVAVWNSLTEAQRTAWSVYAAAIPYTNRVGDVFFLTAGQMFRSCWLAAKSIGVTPVTVAPAALTRPAMDPTLAATVTASTHTVSVAFDNSLAWATAVGGHLAIYMGAPQAQTTNFFKGPFTYLGKIDGAVSPPTSPNAFTTLPFTVSTGQKIFFKTRIILVDGRISPEGTFRCNSVI